MDDVAQMELTILEKNLKKVKSLIKWGHNLRYVAKDFTAVFRYKITAAYDDKHEPFTASEIEALFLNDEFLGRSPKSLSRRAHSAMSQLSSGSQTATI